ncbi:MAG: hypothetical protein OWQ48_00715 [Desulfurococcus sp.]|nr:hypothetical protein [Desulfurococcus sp.]
MPRLVVNVYFTVDEYKVEINKYSEEGRLDETKVFMGVKQLVLENVIARINRQLYNQPWSIIVEAGSPIIEYKEGGLLRIREGVVGGRR